MTKLAATGAEQEQALMNDMVMGMISILYTQSNSVGIAYRGTNDWDWCWSTK